MCLSLADGSAKPAAMQCAWPMSGPYVGDCKQMQSHQRADPSFEGHVNPEFGSRVDPARTTTAARQSQLAGRMVWWIVLQFSGASRVAFPADQA